MKLKSKSLLNSFLYNNLSSNNLDITASLRTHSSSFP
ncbi:hypothetical protein BVRB_6g135830 [Beta vulgaris subsp. vulgaris]|nr:hypothetical protein BVRB_6g135830 [Beta vulgaris subsp. vulgaris]